MNYGYDLCYMARSEKSPVWELAHYCHPAVLALTDSDKQIIRNGRVHLRFCARRQGLA